MWGACPDKHVKAGVSNNLCIVYFNVRSLYSKMDELCAPSKMEKPDVVCLTKTWLGADVVELEYTIPRYECIRLDRNRHGGCVTLFI